MSLNVAKVWQQSTCSKLKQAAYSITEGLTFEPITHYTVGYMYSTQIRVIVQRAPCNSLHTTNTV